MKRWVSLLVIVALVVSLAAIMNGCGKGGKTQTETTEATESVTAAAVSENYVDQMLGELEELASERENYSYTEHSTDEHYEEDYNALTLPPATTAKAKPSTPAVVPQTVRRETTTQFQFTSPSRTPTTGKTASTTKASATSGKNGAQSADTSETAVSDPTVLTERITDSHVVNVSDVVEIPRPNVTYLDKFVIDVLRSGSYTMEAEMKADGYSMPMTYYVNADNYAVKVGMGKAMAEMAGLPGLFEKMGDVRIITKNLNSDPRMYLAWSGGYTELEGDGDESIKDLIGDVDMSDMMQSALMQTDGMVYCGYETHNGYIVETYNVPEENAMYCFYFDGQGLAKWEVIDLSTDQVVETMTINLRAGVADKGAFDLKGKKYTMEEMENMFGGLVG